MYEALDGFNMLDRNHVVPLNMVVPGTVEYEQLHQQSNPHMSSTSQPAPQTEARVETTSLTPHQPSQEKPATDEVVMENAPAAEPIEMLQLAMVPFWSTSTVNEEQQSETPATDNQANANEIKISTHLNEEVGTTETMVEQPKEQTLHSSPAKVYLIKTTRWSLF